MCAGRARLYKMYSVRQRTPGYRLHNCTASFSPQQKTDTSSDEAFEIELKSSGDIFTVNKDSTILSVLEENDVFVPVSCEEGVCGTCVTGLLDGEAEHRDVFLTDEEKQQMRLITPCCSRARSGRLVLDL